MDDFNPDEPLNLIKKKKPVAIVAPSPVNEEVPVQLPEPEPAGAAETMVVAAGALSAEDEERTAVAGSPLASPPDEASCQPLRGAVAPMYAAVSGATSDQLHQQALAANSYVNSMLAASYLNNNNTSSINNNNSAAGANVYGAAPPYAYGGFASVAATATAATVAALTAYSPYADPALINLWAQQAQQRFYEVMNLYGGGAAVAACAVKPEQSMVAAAAAVESKDTVAVATAKDRWRMFEYMLGFQQSELNATTAQAQQVSEPLRVSVPLASASDGAELADSEQLSPKKYSKCGVSGKMKKHHQRYLAFICIRLVKL